MKFQVPESILNAAPQVKPGWTITTESSELAEPAEAGQGEEPEHPAPSVMFVAAAAGTRSTREATEAVMTASPDRRPSPAARWKRAAIVVACSVGAIACGGDDTSVDVLQIEDVWSRPTVAGAENGVVYMSILSPTDDVLDSVAVDPDIAATASLHETTTVTSQGDGDEGSTSDENESHDSDGADMSNMTGMAAVDELPISSGDIVHFEPGGLHVMLEQLTAPLEDGERFRLTLVFREFGERDVEVVVGDGAP